jgi:hypothetical protein
MQEYTHDDIYQIKEEDIIELPRKDIVKSNKKETRTAKYVGFGIAFVFLLTFILGLFIGSKSK